MLSRYARNECLASLAISLSLAASCVLFDLWPLAALPLGLGACVLLFYRDPKRLSPKDRNVAVSPADGKISSIHEIAHFEPFDGPAVCVRVFLSIFDVHVNYCPCHAEVKSITHKAGEHISVLNPRSAEVNESITIIFNHPTHHTPLVAVRQIAGLFARTVHCALSEGQVVQRGSKLGIMKLGSTAELYLPVTPDQVLVRVGQRVVGAITPLAMLPTTKPMPGERAATTAKPAQKSSISNESSSSDLKAYSAVSDEAVVTAATLAAAPPPDSTPPAPVRITQPFHDAATDTAVVSILEEEEETSNETEMKMNGDAEGEMDGEMDDDEESSDLTDHAITQLMQANEVTDTSHSLSASDDGEVLTARMENAGTDLMLHPAEHGEEENQSLAASLAGLRPETDNANDQEDALLDDVLPPERQDDAALEDSGDWKIIPTGKKNKKPLADGLLWEEAP